MAEWASARKLIIFIVCCVVVVVMIYLYMYFSHLKDYKRMVKEIEVKNIDLAKVKDGTYNGNYDVILVGADVNVTVKDKKITDIELVKHKTDKGKSAEVIPQKVVEAQSLQVDTISGATNSSKVILKAIENALEKGE